MHQPNYRDPIRGYYSMPWVRLHATKAYYDMASLAGRYPEAGLTINLVPSLLEQLEDYAAGAEDYELMLSRKAPVDLNAEEKEALLSRFFQAQHDTMITPLPRYAELLQLRGATGTQNDIASALKKFAAQDYLDLQVLFNLSWFGFAAKDDYPELKKLVRKARFYTIEDRDYVLDIQHEIIGKLIPLHKKLWKDGAVDLSASPFYHPILPLLCDTSIAQKGMPGCLLPKQRYVQPGDAAEQVGMALDYFKKILGKKPSGMWPSEGSVSDEALSILRDSGVKWAATDEGILAKSAPSYKRGRDLYMPWEADGVSVFFRDHELSDKIGFVYSRNPAATAVEDFVGRLKSIADSADSKAGARCISVILDGENPWEYYPDSGREFLELLYERLIKEKSVKPVSFTKYLDENGPGGSLKSIFPGSWINGNFDTWMGDVEEADGWDALYNAREVLAEAGQSLSKAKQKEAWREIYRAEGSDWFWWYGEDHSSPNDPEFDRLFRAHLEQVYRLLGRDVPDEVNNPIIQKQLVRADIEPTGLIHPLIDGRMSTFYEWLSAGWVPTAGPAGAMSGGNPLIDAIYYGFDLDHFYLRMDFTEPEEEGEVRDLTNWRFAIQLENGEKYRIDIDAAQTGGATYLIYRKSKDRWIRRVRRDSVAIDRIFEMAVPFEDISASPGERISFVVTVFENDVEHERWPSSGNISFVVPDENFESMMWQV